MANVTYLKGLRTRYNNILKNEVSTAGLLLSPSSLEGDKRESLSKVSTCIERLQTYCYKLESQSEKVTAAVGDDETYTAEILEQDTSLCNSASESCAELKHLERKLQDLLCKEKERSTVNTEKDIKSQMYEEFHQVLEKQMEMQTKLLERFPVNSYPSQLVP